MIGSHWLQILLVWCALPSAYKWSVESFSLPKQACQCAKVKEDVQPEWELANQRKRVKRSEPEDDPEGGTTDEEDRIVGGYTTTQNKPWAVKVWMNPSEFLCGGSLINKRYVLTAGHCVCVPDLGMTCDAKGGKTGNAVYDVKAVISVYLGLNDKLVDYLNKELKGDKQFEYGVESAIAHPNFNGHGSNDIGLLRMDRDAVFIPNRLEPICLPHTFDKSDTVVPGGPELSVYTSGWGRQFSACVTNEFGPKKYIKCKLPFTYKGTTRTECNKNITPSKHDKDCKKMWRKNKAVYPKVPGDVISLFVESTGVTKQCHSFGSGNQGWCQAVNTDDDFTDNWGWCKDNCKYVKGSEEFDNAILPTRLQETRLQLLPMSVCKKLVTSKGALQYNFHGRVDLCAGRKKKFKTIQSYKETVSGEYVFDKNVTNYFGLNDHGNYTYNYYIAGTDSCSGDSGGGLYTWKQGIPTLIGVVSRGWGSNNQNGCAELNFPGLYARVASFLPWIYENSKSGNC